MAVPELKVTVDDEELGQLVEYLCQGLSAVIVAVASIMDGKPVPTGLADKLRKFAFTQDESEKESTDDDRECV